MINWVGAVGVSRAAEGEAAAEGDPGGTGRVVGVGEGIEGVCDMAAVEVGSVWAGAGVEVTGAEGSDAVVSTAVECGPVGVVSSGGGVRPDEVGADGAARVLVAAGVDGWTE